MKFLLLGLCMAATLWIASAEEENAIVCYYEGGEGANYYKLNNLNATEDHKCNYIIYAFAILDSDSQTIKVNDLNDITEYKSLTKIKNVKKLLALGGKSDSEGTKYNKYKNLVNSKAKRTAFIENVVKFLKPINKEYEFDGLDLDWEYPLAADKQGFLDLVKELKIKFQEEKLLLTAAVSYREAGDNGYHQDLCKHLDKVHLMTYDFHSYYGTATCCGKSQECKTGWDYENNKGIPIPVNHHSPLSHIENTHEAYNTEYLVDYWIDEMSCEEHQLVIGVPLYGISYTLKDGSKNSPGATACAKGEKGVDSDESGLLSYREICTEIKGGKLTKVKGNLKRGPYAYSTVSNDAEGISKSQWVGYDDKDIVGKKATYAKTYGGVLVWAINYADYDDSCGDEDEKTPYPLLTEMRKKLGKYIPK